MIVKRNTDLSGARFGRLKVHSLSHRKGGKRYWNCVCDCGRTTTVPTTHLQTGNTSSCGCLAIENYSTANMRHGGRHTPEYSVWGHMIRRCHRPAAVGYRNYGARGISVCPEWRNSFAAFLRDVGPRPSPKHTLDRINNDGHYEPGNVRWTTRKAQMRNTRVNLVIDYNGQSKTLVEWSESLGVNYHTLHARVRRGWPIDRVLGTTIRRRSILFAKGVQP